MQVELANFPIKVFANLEFGKGEVKRHQNLSV
jgi:hypothetical protein